MRTTLKRATFGALALAILAAVAPAVPASADTGDTLRGGCRFHSASGGIVTGENEGVIYDASISQEASGGPSFATVECWIDVNGVKQDSTDLIVSGTGTQQGARDVMFTAGDTDAVSLCTQVTFDPNDGSIWTAPDGNVGTDCPAATEVQVPPQQVVDAVDSLCLAIFSPTICALLETVFDGATLRVLQSL